MTCVLRALGEGFEPEAFLDNSPLQRAVVYHKEEPLPGVSPGRRRSASGFDLDVGTTGFADIAGQIRAALELLDEHEEELRRLGGFPGVDHVVLEFGMARQDVAAQADLFPAELLWKLGALDIDLAVTHYRTVEPG